MNIGDFKVASFHFTQDDVINFSEISGDKNPIHLDLEFAKKTVFKRPIIHGFLGGSIFSKIIGTDFPGKGTIYLRQNMSFRKPMYVEETYTAKVEIAEKYPEKNQALLVTTIINNDGEFIIKGEALVLNLDRL